MTTTHRPPRTPSLRQLAREWGVHHSTVSAAVHDGRIRDGVRIEGGKVRVTDADAATAAWRAVHAPGILELERAALRAPARHAAPDAEVVLYDRSLDCRVTARKLFEDRDALSVLVTALAAAAVDNASGRVDRRKANALRKRVAERLRTVAELHGADADDLEAAESELAGALDLLAMRDEDEEERAEPKP